MLALHEDVVHASDGALHGELADARVEVGLLDVDGAPVEGGLHRILVLDDEPLRAAVLVGGA